MSNAICLIPTFNKLFMLGIALLFQAETQTSK